MSLCYIVFKREGEPEFDIKIPEGPKPADTLDERQLLWDANKFRFVGIRLYINELEIISL